MAARQTSHPIEWYEPHAKQQGFHDSPARIRAFLGANRSGKTVAGATEVVKAVLAKPTLVWVVSVDFPSSRDVAQPEIFNWLPPSEIISYNKGDRIVTLRDGSIIGFKSCESGRESFQGTSRDIIWFDEEPPEDIFLESYARTVDCAGRILFTLTPIKGSLWLWEFLKRDDVYAVYAGMQDNPHLPPEEIKAAERMYTGEERRVRVYGEYILMAGGWPRFNRTALQRLLEVKETHQVGDVVHGAFLPAERGPLSLYEAPIPKERYIIAADNAEGIPGGDWDAVAVLRRSTGRIVATWHGRIPRHAFAGVVLELARWFNSGILAPEINQGGEIVQAALDAHYGNIYRQQTYNVQDQRETTRLGWKTDGRTRPLMLSTLEQRINDGSGHLDPDTIAECLTFIRTDEKPDGEAGPKSHDDRVIAAAIAYQVDRDMPRGQSHRLTPGGTAYEPANAVTGY